MNGPVVPLLGCHDLIQKHILTTNDSRRRLNLAMQNEITNEELNNENGVNGEGSKIKKAFVEPTISVPVDVLEATTFFQSATSGATN